MRPQEAQTPLKIERQSDGKTTIIWLIGRIRSEDLEELKAQTNDSSERMVLDLHEVTLGHANVNPIPEDERGRGDHIGSLPAVRARVDSTRTSGRRNSE